jgi:ferredoxin
MIEAGQVPPGLLPDAEAAVRICPLLALRLTAASE